MSKQLKTYLSNEISTRLDGIEGGVLINALALNSEQTYAFRKAMQARKLRYRVLRNNLACRVFAERGYRVKDLEKVFTGPIGIVFGEGEGAAKASSQAVFDWKREVKDKKVEWKGALLDGAVLNSKDAENLRTAMGKAEARAMLAGALQAPISKFAATLQEMYARFAYAVHALEKKRSEDAPSA